MSGGAVHARPQGPRRDRIGMQMTTRSIVSCALAMLISITGTGCSVNPGTVAHREAEARDVLSDRLMDAESARFRNVVSKDVTREGQKVQILCGQVNAKNQMGAYVGFRDFIVVPEERFGLVDPAAMPGNDEATIIAQGSFYDAYAYCDPATPKPAAALEMLRRRPE